MVTWPIGCFTRPWRDFTVREALDGIHKAGYEYVGLMRAVEFGIVTEEGPREKVAELKDLLLGYGLKPLVVLAYIDLSSEEVAVKKLRGTVDRTKLLGAKFILTAGTMNPAEYERFYEVMRSVAPYAADQGVMLVLKPHGGVSATAKEMRTCVERIGRKGFGIMYDAGNIIHYTGQEPVQDLPEVVEHVVAFCVKDCHEKGGEVMFTPGTGRVDFRLIFSILKQARFDGPLMVECVGGATLAEINEEAAKTYGLVRSWLPG